MNPASEISCSSLENALSVTIDDPNIKETDDHSARTDQFFGVLTEAKTAEFAKSFSEHGRRASPFIKTDFAFKRTLGKGSFGQVLLVTRNETQQEAALKVLRKDMVTKMRQVDHVLDEKRILSSMAHKSLIALLDCFKDNSNLYMLLELAAGGELFTLHRAKRLFTEQIAKFYAAQVFMALDYLHNACNVVYRDLKPENVVRTLNGYLRVTDLGFAKCLTGRKSYHCYTVCGTPEYMAPEIMKQQGYSKAVDWWAFGILLFEFCVGYSPFFKDNAKNDVMAIYERAAKDEGKGTYFHNTSIVLSKPLRYLITNLLQPDSTKRFGQTKGGTRTVRNSSWFRENTKAQYKSSRYVQNVQRELDVGFEAKFTMPFNWDTLYEQRYEAPYSIVQGMVGDSLLSDEAPPTIPESASPKFTKEFENF